MEVLFGYLRMNSKFNNSLDKAEFVIHNMEMNKEIRVNLGYDIEPNKVKPHIS